MEKTISKEELAKIMPFSYDEKVLYFPIRHHSPVCSVQILRVISEYEPDLILIEGPDNANHILEFLASEETSFPVALYYSYKDSNNKLDDSTETQSYSCYYPMLEYSPELVAIKSAFSNNIPVKFIDLPFGKRLLSTQNNSGVRRRLDKNNYSDDYLISSTKIAHALCEETNFSNFDSFWEAYFEINGLSLSPKEFAHQFNAYTYLLRKGTTQEELIADSTIIREQYMGEKIAEHREKYDKILVITGGFHTLGLMRPENSEVLEYNTTKAEDESIYLMPYSMDEADALNGYASGMLSPGFYDIVWQNIKHKVDKPYNTAVLNLILQTAKDAKRKKVLITMSDEASAFSIAEGLARLRNKAECGKYECLDGVLSSFIKGDLNPATELPLDILNSYFKGDKIGEIPKNSPTPPIVSDFLERAKSYRLKTEQSVRKEIVLSIFSKENHRQISRFFHTLSFLDINFCTKIRGSNLKDDKDRNIIRETWEYRLTPMVITRLIENSANGASVSVAAYHLLSKKIKESKNSSDSAKLLVDSFLMGINDTLELLLVKTIDAIAVDDDFFSLGETLYHLIHLYRLKEFYGEKSSLDYEKLIDLCFKKTLNTFELYKNTGEENEQQVLKIIKLMFDISSKDEFSYLKAELRETFEKILYKEPINPVIFGAINGILYAMGELLPNIITHNFNSFIIDKDKAILGAKFLTGVFYTARDIIFVGDEFLLCINNLITSLDSDDFISILPDFKLTFSYFTPSEIDRISRKVSKILSFEGYLLDEKGISEEVLNYGNLLNDYLKEKLKEELL